MADLLLIIDGAEDEKIPLLQDRTPFEAAFTPCFDEMRRNGETGFFDLRIGNRPVDSLSCIMTLLGVPKKRIPEERAYLESLAYDISVKEGDCICRLNLVSLDKNGTLISSLGEYLTEPEYRFFVEAVRPLLQKYSLRLFPMTSYKNLLIFPKEKGEEDHTTFPPHEHLGKPLESLLPKNRRLKQFSEETKTLLLPYSKNGVTYTFLPWGIAKKEDVPTFQSLHGFSGAVAAATEIVRGFSKALGLRVDYEAGFTGDVDTDLIKKAACAVKLLREEPFVMLHINGADEVSHRKDPLGKKAFLERMDGELLSPLMEQVPLGTRILVTSDHSTLSLRGCHRGDPQPFVLWEKGKRRNRNYPVLPGIDAVKFLRGR